MSLPKEVDATVRGKGLNILNSSLVYGRSPRRAAASPLA